MGKKLGFGCMRLPLLENGEIDIQQFKEMVDEFISRGFDYFDTAYGYNRGKSEEAIKAAIVDRYPRESFRLATKLPAWAGPKSAEEAKQMFYTSLERTGAGYFDNYLLHNLGSWRTPYFDKWGLWDFIKDLKEQGLVKNIGFSIHDNAEALTQILDEHPGMIDFVQIQLNYVDWDNPGIQSGECYRICTERNIPVYVMEPVKGGTLANVPTEVEKIFREYDPISSPASWAIRYAASCENVAVVLSGMSNMEQLEDNLSYMEDFKPLNEEERKIIQRVVEKIKEASTVPCTGCSYCTDGCPRKIAIPRYFAIYNADIADDSKTKGWKSGYAYYESLRLTGGKPEDCVQCGQCSRVCPQHIDVVQHLKNMVEYFKERS